MMETSVKKEVHVHAYDGYYALVVVVLPAFIWGIPKIRKLKAEKKEIA